MALTLSRASESILKVRVAGMHTPVAMVVVAAQLVAWSISVPFSCAVLATGSAAPLVAERALVARDLLVVRVGVETAAKGKRWGSPEPCACA